MGQMLDHSNAASAYWINKFGRNPEVDAGQVQDIWDFGGDGNGETYSWPAAAADTTVVSSSVADTAAGTGAKTIQIQGLNSEYEVISKTVALNGTTPVALTTQFLRVFRAKIVTAGSGETNAGNVDVKHGATIIARVTLGFGQTLMALYTVPIYRVAKLAGWHANIKISNNGTQAFRLDVRPFGGAWNCKETFELGGTSGAHFYRKFRGWQSIPAKSDIRIRAYGGSDANTVVSAGFDLMMS